MTKQYVITLFFLCAFVIGNAQISSNNNLYKGIMQKDSLLFKEAFNKCNIDVLYDVIDEDFEFYHDQSGTTHGKAPFIESIRKNICALSYKPSRRLVKGSTEMFPLYNNGEVYGLIQHGVHEFYASEANKEPYLTSIAKFTHLWIKKDNNWTLKRSLSYDHKSPKQTPEATSSNVFENTESIEAWMQKRKVPILGVATIKNNKLNSVNVYGKLAHGEVAPENTIFNVASLTKPVVSMLTLNLVNKGLWDLDEPLHKYWTDPDVADHAYSKLLTTRHVLSHQTGFPNWRRENPLQFQFKPGTKYGYSGEGFEYLRMALEKKFNKPLEDLVNTMLFKPLKINDTKFFWDASVNESRFARWYKDDGVSTHETYKSTKASAADDLLTTVSDYGKFAEFVLNGAGLSNDLFKEMICQQNNKSDKIKMGLGWEIIPLKNNEYALLHTGADQGIHALCIIIPATGEGLVAFTNSDNGNQLYFSLVENYLSRGKQIVESAK